MCEGSRGFARGASLTHPSNLPSETKKSEGDSPRAFPFLFDDRTRTCTCQYLYNSLYAHGDTMPGDGVRFSST